MIDLIYDPIKKMIHVPLDVFLSLLERDSDEGNVEPTPTKVDAVAYVCICPVGRSHQVTHTLGCMRANGYEL